MVLEKSAQVCLKNSLYQLNVSLRDIDPEYDTEEKLDIQLVNTASHEKYEASLPESCRFISKIDEKTLKN
jgi:hypothetical protein